MRTVLIAFYAFVLVAMIALTVAAAADRGVLEAGRALWPDPWFRATLADAYFAFATIWLWIAWRERSVPRAAVWFLLVMGLGNLAIAGYAIWRLSRWSPRDGAAALLLPSR